MALESLLQTRFEDLLSGKKKAYDLPEFQSMKTMLEKTGATTRAGTARQMRQMGISGPSVGMTLQGMQEKELAPMSGTMGGMMASLPDKAAQWGSQQRGMDIQRELGHGQLREMRKSRKLAEDQAMMSSQMGGGCVLTEACYGEKSIEVCAVRRLRDAMKSNPVAEKIIRGYYVFSDLILPAMKFNFIKSVVKQALIAPLLRMIVRKFGYSIDPWMTPIDRGIAFLALSLWKIMGSRGPYTRKNGERV